MWILAPINKKGGTCQVSGDTCHMSHVAFYLLPVTCHMSLKPTATSTATDPPPANSPTMKIRTFCKYTTIYFFPCSNLSPLLSKNFKFLHHFAYITFHLKIFLYLVSRSNTFCKWSKTAPKKMYNVKIHFVVIKIAVSVEPIMRLGLIDN